MKKTLFLGKSKVIHKKHVQHALHKKVHAKHAKKVHGMGMPAVVKKQYSLGEGEGRHLAKKHIKPLRFKF